MDVICLYLFVYGTLLDAGNQNSVYLHKHCTFQKKGRFKGRLYDTGEYPGAIADEHSRGYVHGSIYFMNNAPAVLQAIDDYEGFGRDQQQPNLFVRRLVDIETNSRLITCWAYLYNLPVDGLILIPSGDYLTYKAEKA